jgi:hypothetical protein
LYAGEFPAIRKPLTGALNIKNKLYRREENEKNISAEKTPQE